jgi:hypothetical protein
MENHFDDSGHECEFCHTWNAQVSVLITGAMQFKYACTDCATLNFVDKAIHSIYRWTATAKLHWVKVI